MKVGGYIVDTKYLLVYRPKAHPPARRPDDPAKLGANSFLQAGGSTRFGSNLARCHLTRLLCSSFALSAFLQGAATGAPYA